MLCAAHKTVMITGNSSETTISHVYLPLSSAGLPTGLPHIALTLSFAPLLKLLRSRNQAFLLPPSMIKPFSLLYHPFATTLPCSHQHASIIRHKLEMTPWPVAGAEWGLSKPSVGRGECAYLCISSYQASLLPTICFFWTVRGKRILSFFRWNEFCLDTWTRSRGKYHITEKAKCLWRPLHDDKKHSWFGL